MRCPFCFLPKGESDNMSRKHAFTLIVLIAIIAILAAILFPTYLQDTPAQSNSGVAYQKSLSPNASAWFRED
jgi:type II secretory pathway pseudopilin PulG